MNDAIIIQAISIAIVAGTPLVLAGTGEVLTQRSGVLNLGVEGMMLMGAVSGFWATTATGNPWIGLVVGMIAGLLTALIHGFLAIRLNANQIVTGIGVVIFGAGLSKFIGEMGSPPIAVRPGNGSFDPLIDTGIANVPILGPVLFSHDAIVYLSWLIVAASSWYLFHTRRGLELRAVGNNPAAADAAGINVAATRFFHVAIGGAAAGAGGAYMTLALFNSWSAGIVAGTGWLAVVLVIFSGWRPWRMLFAAYTLGVVSSLGFTLQVIGIGVPRELLLMLPFIATLVVLIAASAFGIGESEPSALAEPYVRERR
ncbi:MAG: ABC transporter permease [Acidimicrobiia bacterium]|nr:MAG: ABC transporter permease [Acidimicrobiia bacterium]